LASLRVLIVSYAGPPALVAKARVMVGPQE